MTHQKENEFNDYRPRACPWGDLRCLIRVQTILMAARISSFPITTNNLFLSCMNAFLLTKYCQCRKGRQFAQNAELKNTNLAAPGALAHYLQHCTSLKIQTGSGKVSIIKFLGTPVNFSSISFLIRALLL